MGINPLYMTYNEVKECFKKFDTKTLEQMISINENDIARTREAIPYYVLETQPDLVAHYKKLTLELSLSEKKRNAINAILEERKNEVLKGGS